MQQEPRYFRFRKLPGFAEVGGLEYDGAIWSRQSRLSKPLAAALDRSLTGYSERGEQPHFIETDAAGNVLQAQVSA